MVIALLLNILLVIGLASGQVEVESRIVTIEQGLVRGYKTHGVFAFYGIPYAVAPKGADRYKPPLPAPTWPDTFEATNQNIYCPQVFSELFEDLVNWQEDCLVVNIFVPQTNATFLPVVVYIHGGAYNVGASTLEKVYSMLDKGNYIAVSINYRVGVVGFLCLGTEDVPGNAGMKDQVAALRWVSKNIASFGGNPHDVTISGVSAGSTSAQLLMLSEPARGLFHKVNAESGSVLGVWTVQMDPLAAATRFASSLNFTSQQVFELEAFYKSASLKQLTSKMFWKERDSTFMFTPCIERDTGSGSEIFLKELPIDIIERGDFPKMPMLIGFSNMEGQFRAEYFNEWKHEMNADFSNFLPADLEFETQAQKTETASVIKRFYFGNQSVSDTTRQEFVNYFGDVMFAYPVLKLVKLLVGSGNDEVYLYQYSFVNDLIFNKTYFPELGGADHATQSFAVRSINNSTYTNNFQIVRGMLKELWSNFFVTGQPVPEPTATMPDWPALSPNSSSYMELNLHPELREGLLAERVRFWDDIYERFGRKPVAPSWQSNVTASLGPCGLLLHAAFLVVISLRQLTAF